jgi:hypothetical protein
MIKTNILKSLIFLVLLSCTLTIVYAQETQNLTAKDQASLCLNESETYFMELIDANFSTNRVNDTLKEMKNLYEAQVELSKRKNDDFSLILPYCKEISKIKEDAFNTIDEYKALMEFYNEFLEEGMNTSSIDQMIQNIRFEIESERYERVKPLIDEAYEEIVEVKSKHTALNLFYSATSRTFKDFFIENWVYLSGGTGIIILFYMIYKSAITRMWIKRKIKNAELKKKTLKGLIQKAQRDYFEKGNLSSGDYGTKTKKFAELIREIDRDLPLLKEELIRTSNKKGDISTLLYPSKKEHKKEGKKK